MQNQINTQYLPQGNYNQCQMTPQTPVCQAPNCYPMGPSVGAVNIQIYNPTANPQGMYQPYPYNYNNMFQQQQMMPSIQPTQRAPSVGAAEIGFPSAKPQVRLPFRF